MKQHKLKLAGIVLLLIIGGAIFINRFNYDEPAEGMDVSSGITENDEQLDYWLETDFIPNAKYTVSLTLYLPTRTDESFLVEPLNETTFRADENEKRFEDSISIQEIKEAILNVDDLNFDDLELVAENWRDYEYVVGMHRTKFWKTYDSVGMFNKLQRSE